MFPNQSIVNTKRYPDLIDIFHSGESEVLMKRKYSLDF